MLLGATIESKWSKDGQKWVHCVCTVKLCVEELLQMMQINKELKAAFKPYMVFYSQTGSNIFFKARANTYCCRDQKQLDFFRFILRNLRVKASTNLTHCHTKGVTQQFTDMGYRVSICATEKHLCV